MTSWQIAFVDRSSRYEQLFISLYKKYITPWITKIRNQGCQSGLRRLTLLVTTLGQIATTNHILERLQSWQLQDEEEDADVARQDVEEAAGVAITGSPCPLLQTTASLQRSLEEAGDAGLPSRERQNTPNEATASGVDCESGTAGPHSGPCCRQERTTTGTTDRNSSSTSRPLHMSSLGRILMVS